MADVLEELSGSAARLYKSIEEVIIKEGVLEDDPIIWEIHILGATLKIEAEKLEHQGVFRTQYLRKFRMPAPRVKTEEWHSIIELLATEKASVQEELEESEKVNAARQVFEEICRLPVSEDKEVALSKGNLFEHDGCLCVASSKVSEIMQKNGIKIGVQAISGALVDLGLKEKGSEKIACGKARGRAWHFIRTYVWAQKGQEEVVKESDCKEAEKCL